MSKLPPGWVATTIGEVAEVVTGKTPPTNEARLFDGSVPFARPGDLNQATEIVTTETSISEAAFAHVPRIPAGSILVSCIGNLGKTGILARDGACNQQLNAVLPSPAATPKFLRAWAKTLRPWLEANSSATTVRIINKGRFLGAPLPLPPVAEQHRIVAKLEALESRSRRAREALNAVPAMLEKLRQSILAAAFRGDLTKVWRAKNPNVEPASELLKRIREERRKKWEEVELAKLKAKGKTPTDDKWKGNYKEPQRVGDAKLPELPSGWSWTTVEELASDEPRSIQSGPFGSNLLHSEFQKSGVLAIGIDNVQDGRFSMGAEHRVSELKFEELKKYAARPGDILVTVMATVGRCCVVPEDLEPAIITKHVYRVSPERALVRPHYLLQSMRGAPALRDAMKEDVRGQTRPGINGEILRNLPVPIAPLNEQDAILSAVSNALDAVDRIGASHTATTQGLEQLERSLLAKAFRGELVAQEPADEPADVMLARMRGSTATPADPAKKQKAPKQQSLRRTRA